MLSVRFFLSVCLLTILSRAEKPDSICFGPWIVDPGCSQCSVNGTSSPCANCEKICITAEYLHYCCCGESCCCYLRYGTCDRNLHCPVSYCGFPDKEVYQNETMTVGDHPSD